MDAELGKSEAKVNLRELRAENLYYRLLLQDQKSLFKETRFLKPLAS